MARIHRILDRLRDNDGVINPTRYRLANEGRDLIYDATAKLKTPLEFIVEKLPQEVTKLNVVLPEAHLTELHSWEINYAHQQILRSPYIARCDVACRDTPDRSVTLITENTDPFALVKREGIELTPQQAVHDANDVLPGGKDWKDLLEKAQAAHQKKRAERKLQQIGLLAHLREIGFGPYGFALDFMERAKTGLYTVRMFRSGPSRSMSATEQFEVYSGYDRSFFLRSLQDVLASEFRARATNLVGSCHPSPTNGWNEVLFEVYMRREHGKRVEENEPLTMMWLAEAAQLPKAETKRCREASCAP